MAPLSQCIEDQLHPVVHRAARQKRPAHIAFATAALRWPDWSQARRYVQGFRIIGDIETSNIFRQFGISDEHSINVEVEQEFFGPAARAAVEAIEASPPPRDAEDIWEITLRTIEKGSARPPATKAAMDAKYGVGRWRPMPTFLVTQACGKKGVINDGARGQQNLYTRMLETIFTLNVDFITVILAAILTEFLGISASLAVAEILPLLPEWAALEMGLDDIPDAYNGTPVVREQAAANIAAVYCPETSEWLHVEQGGLGFGLQSAVPSFCRMPLLTASTARRVSCVPCGNYFDDLPTVDVRGAAGVSRAHRMR